MQAITNGPRERPSRRRALAIGAVLLVLGSGGYWGCHRGAGPSGHADDSSEATYYCPMHPNYRSDKPGNCPICSMRLVPLKSGSPSAAAPSAATPGQARSEAAPPAAPGGPAPADSAPGAGASAQRIRITPERQQQIGVKFAEAARKPAIVETRAVGRVAYDETGLAHVHTKVSGWIEDVYVDFVGAPVKRGQPLFTIYSPDLVSSQEEYLLALRARDELSGSSIARVSQGSRALLDSARRRLELWDITPAQIQALETEGRVSRTVTVASPVGGVVLERAAYHHGRTVTPEMDLYTIVDLSRVWVLGSVYEYEAPFVRVGQRAEISLPYEAEHKVLQGRVNFIAPFLDPKTRTVQVRMEFANPGLSLRPESFVNVVLRRDLGKVLVVPGDAVLDTGVSQYVFVDKGDGYLEPRQVKPGPQVSSGRVITSGLEEGERVVMAANFILDSESRLKGALDAMGRPVPAEAPAGSASTVTAEVTTEPSPAKVGRNRVHATIKDASGQAIPDADVEIRLFMPQMAGMAQVDVRAPLKSAGGGVYVGDVDIPIAWSFETTITVRKGGQVVGTAQTTITSR
jgi:membrane fusion protein, copper/silver efflux system